MDGSNGHRPKMLSKLYKAVVTGFMGKNAVTHGYIDHFAGTYSASRRQKVSAIKLLQHFPPVPSDLFRKH